MKEYSKGIYVKFKPEEVDILHNRMQEAGMQFLSWVMHLTFVTHIFLLYHIIRI